MSELVRDYGIPASRIIAAGWKWEEGNERLYMPIHNSRGYVTGGVAKNIGGVWDGPKAVTYWQNRGEEYHVPVNCPATGPLVVVEDIISAEKVAAISRSAALLGTHLSADTAEALSALTDHLKIFLDEDAIDKAIKMKSAYGLLFKKCDIIYHTKDPKDTSYDKLEELIL
jgi:DNA primase